MSLLNSRILMKYLLKLLIRSFRGCGLRIRCQIVNVESNMENKKFSNIYQLNADVKYCNYYHLKCFL